MSTQPANGIALTTGTSLKIVGTGQKIRDAKLAILIGAGTLHLLPTPSTLHNARGDHFEWQIFNWFPIGVLDAPINHAFGDQFEDDCLRFGANRGHRGCSLRSL